VIGPDTRYEVTVDLAYNGNPMVSAGKLIISDVLAHCHDDRGYLVVETTKGSNIIAPGVWRSVLVK
jgi:hypothetical protein